MCVRMRRKSPPCSEKGGGKTKKIALSSKTAESLLSRRKGKTEKDSFLLLYAGNIEGSAANFLGREGEDEKGGAAFVRRRSGTRQKNTAQG